MSEKEVSTRIYENDREQLNLMSNKYGMKASLILGHLIKKAVEYNILEEGWEAKLAESQLHDFLLEADLEYKKQFERDKHRAILKAKQTAFQELIKVMPVDERKSFLEQILGDPTNNGDFLDNLSSYQMFTIDGVRRLLAPDGEGGPIVPGIHPDNIIECERGFHIVKGFCKCQLWKICQIRKEEYEHYLATSGSREQQNRYLDRHDRRYR